MNERSGLGPADQLDAILWMAVPALILLLVGVGEVSGDAVKHANRFADGVLMLNPNHLLMEPIAKAWFDFTESLNLQMVGPDRLKALDIVAGSLSLGVFRLLVPRRFQASRFLSNLSTAVLGGGFAYLSLWISGEPIILQMMPLVIGIYFVVRYVQGPNFRDAFLAGGAFGIATLFFISNGVITLFVVAGIAAWRWRDGGLEQSTREIAALVGSWLFVCVVGLTLGWLASDPGVSLHRWIFLYKGETPASETAYGLFPLSVQKLVTAIFRAGYGATMAFVDVSSVVDFYRDGMLGSVGVLSGICAVITGVSVGYGFFRLCMSSRGVNRMVWPLAGWIIGVFVFGFFFNNSDDQFFVQLSIPVAVLAASLSNADPIRHKRLLLGACALVLMWNAGYVWQTKVRYPRSARLAELTTGLRGGDVVIYPGHDEPGRLLHLLPDSVQHDRLSLMRYAQNLPDTSGIPGAFSLQDSVAILLESGNDIRVISVFGVDEREHPWQLLKGLGLPHKEVVESLRKFEVTRVTGEESYFGIYRLRVGATRAE